MHDLISPPPAALQYLFEIMPPATAKHRLNNVLMAGCDAIQDKLANVTVPALVIYGDGDRVLPSVDEAQRLKKLMPDCKVKQVEGAGHLALDGDRVNCTRIIQQTPSVAPVSWRKDPVLDWVMPSTARIEEASESSRTLRRLASPVFFSAGPAGDIEVGLRPLKADVLNKGRPVLFVGNHQLLALDLSLMLEGVWRETGTLLRGLAHPMLFQGGGGVPGLIGGSSREGGEGENMYQTFGAVPVSGRNAHKLLARGDAVLLFPGGIGEALHGKDEYYKLKWPERTDFVRLAARFNATIVPFAGLSSSPCKALPQSNFCAPCMHMYLATCTIQLKLKRRRMRVVFVRAWLNQRGGQAWALRMLPMCCSTPPRSRSLASRRSASFWGGPSPEGERRASGGPRLGPRGSTRSAFR